jgi:hypothetical protein
MGGFPPKPLSTSTGLGPKNELKEIGLNKNVLQQSDHRLEQVLRATDLLLESGGFGLIALDLGDLPPLAARRIPLTTWFRFRRAVEYTPTILLAIEQHPIAGSCSSLLLQLGTLESNSGSPPAMPFESHTCTTVHMDSEHHRRTYPFAPRPQTRHSVAFATKTAWAG